MYLSKSTGFNIPFYIEKWFWKTLIISSLPVNAFSFGITKNDTLVPSIKEKHDWKKKPTTKTNTSWIYKGLT